MANELLNDYISSRPDLKFVFTSTAISRSYEASWEIIDNKLFLVAFKAYLDGYVKVDLNYLFPGQTSVFASWVTDSIRLPYGKLIEYVHGGYGSTYKNDRFLEFENGILINDYVVDNTDLNKDTVIKSKKILSKHERDNMKLLKKIKIQNQLQFLITLLGSLIVGIGISFYMKIGLTYAVFCVYVSYLSLFFFVICMGYLVTFGYRNNYFDSKVVAFGGSNFLFLVFMWLTIATYHLLIKNTFWTNLVGFIFIAAKLTFMILLIRTFILNLNEKGKKNEKS